MKFLCCRTSQWDGQPCEEAVQERHVYIEMRTFKTPEEYQKSLREDWFAHGANHRILHGGIARDVDAGFVWVVDLPDLDAVAAFIHKYKSDVVIGEEHRYVGIDWKIEIYDDYRE